MPFFRGMKLDAITPFDVERFKAWLTVEHGASPRSVNIHQSILSSVLKAAIQAKVVTKNPVDDVSRMKETKQPKEVLTVEEVRHLLDAEHITYIFQLLLCALHTGMRKSELLHLRWEAVDFEQGILYVQPDPTTGWTPKNRKVRAIRMTRELASALSGMERSGDYVFMVAGKRIGDFRKTLARVLDRAGISKRVTLHTLRHTFTSHLARQGVPSLHIRDALGHASVTTTELYIHLTAPQAADTRMLPYARASALEASSDDVVTKV